MSTEGEMQYRRDRVPSRSSSAWPPPWLKVATVAADPALEARAAPVERPNDPISSAIVSVEKPDSGDWDSARATQAIAEVDRVIDAALAAGDVANTPSRRRILEDDKAIVRSRAQEKDPILWGWPASVRALLDRWQQDDEKASG
jgi:hypothetical protein